MMNTYEDSVRKLAHQIWESEGRPNGHEYRHWEMACKLAKEPINEDMDEIGSADNLSVIAPEEPFDPAPPQPEQPVPPNVPVNPISPTEPQPHISPTPPPQPIQPSDPVQPGNPNQPIQPYASKRTMAPNDNRDEVKLAEKKPAKKNQQKNRIQ